MQDDELLLDKITIESAHSDVENTEINDYIRQQTNTRAFGFWRVNLHVYNLSRDRDKRFSNWLRRVGEAPVIFDSTLMHRSRDQIKLLFNNRGYFDAQVTDSMASTAKKKCHVYYKISPGKPYFIGNLGFRVDDDELKEIIYPDTINSLLHSGDRFDVDHHNAERERISRSLYERGYYSFGKDYCIFYADSSRVKYLVDDSLIVINPLNDHHRQAIIDSVIFIINPSEKPQKQTDLEGMGLFYEDELIFQKKVLSERCFIRPGTFFSLSDVENTQERLHSLPLFSQVNIKFQLIENPDTVYDHLISQISVHMADRQSYSVELEGTNSSGNFGVAGAVGYAHKNIFHHAEVFDIKYRIATQNQSAKDGKEHFFTFETGVDAGITAWKFLFPWVHADKFNRRKNPTTRFSFSYDYQRRPDFTKSAFATRVTYTWKTSEYVRHTLIPIEFNIVDIPRISENFSSYINQTYLKFSYTNHFIWSTNYTFLYNKLGYYFRSSVETAGNFIGLFTDRVFGIDNSQYVKADAEFRWKIEDVWKNNFVFRFYAGAGLPYGDSKALPFEKSFFVGGANSIRAWAVRGLGPGSSKRDEQTRYNNQTSDMRLEMNGEYRLKIISILEGAVFCDAGNIWALPHLTDDDDAKISKDFYKQIAFGGGLGLRLNFSYFVLRLDAAVKFHDPSADKGSRWVIGCKKFRWDDINWNFAIGYPF